MGRCSGCRQIQAGCKWMQVGNGCKWDTSEGFLPSSATKYFDPNWAENCGMVGKLSDHTDALCLIRVNILGLALAVFLLLCSAVQLISGACEGRGPVSARSIMTTEQLVSLNGLSEEGRLPQVKG